MTEPVLEFDALTHTYKLDGVVLPSVTQVLTEVGLIDPTYYTEETRDRGTYVHMLTKLDDEGRLHEPCVTPEYMGYLEAWREFRRVMDIKIVEIEEAVYHPLYRYAGKRDRIVDWWHPTGARAGVLDIKTGSPAAWHSLQTAAYQQCTTGAVVRVIRVRHAVYLKPDGKYTLQEHTDRDDWPAFVGALAYANWRRNRGLIKEAI